VLKVHPLSFAFLYLAHPPLASRCKKIFIKNTYFIKIFLKGPFYPIPHLVPICPGPGCPGLDRQYK
jgi:hypothetical protein